LLTLRPPRQSLLEGPSTVFCVAVVAWIVLMRPSTMPNLSCMTLAIGARQLVVQDALEILLTSEVDVRVNRETVTHNSVLGIIFVQVDTTYVHGGIGGRS
jgi:hypothetical protein